MISDVLVIGNWFVVGSNIWLFFLSVSLGCLLVDGSEVLCLSILVILGQVDNVGVIGVWFYDMFVSLLYYYFV